MKESLFSTCHRDVKNILSSHSETESHINTTQCGREPFVSSPGSSVICCPTCTLHAPHRLQLQPSAFLCVCVCVCVCVWRKYTELNPILQIYVVLGTLDHSNAAYTHKLFRGLFSFPPLLFIISYSSSQPFFFLSLRHSCRFTSLGP